MNFTIKNEILIKNVKQIIRLLSKNNSFPILENILIEIKDNILFLTTTNLEIEIISKIKILTYNESGKTTVSGKKFFNICKNLPLTSEVKIYLKKNKLYISSENSNYILTTLPGDNFPNHQNFTSIASLNISSNVLKEVIEKTAFSMGKQDVRYYLNGMLLEKKDNLLNIVTTDGYRLSIATINLEKDKNFFSIIIPSKGVFELYRLLNIKSKLLKIFIGSNNIRIHINNFIFTSQLIEGKYPDYISVLSSKKNHPILINSILLKKSLLRASILTHEKFCGIEIKIENGKFEILSDNQEEEIAKDVFNVNYFGSTIEISINVYYILDVLHAINNENILFFINPNKSSVQIEAENNPSNIYVIMLLKR